MTLDLNEIEALVSRAKRQPLSTFLVVSAIVVALATGAWITSFFGEMGKHHATPNENKQNPVNKQSINFGAKEKSSKIGNSPDSDKKLQPADSLPAGENEPISETLNQILENQKNILERLHYLENNISSASVDSIEIDKELAQLSSLLDDTISFLGSDSRLSKELDRLATRAELENRNTQKASNKTLAAMWRNQEEKIRELRHEINERHYQAISLSRDLSQNRLQIQSSIKLHAMDSVMESLLDVYSGFENLTNSIAPILSNEITTINENEM